MTADTNLQLKRLEAENKRLKRVMQRMYQGVWGITPQMGQLTESDTTGYLPLQLSSILVSNLSFDEKINKVLQIIGQFVDVSRIYIFQNFDDNRKCKNTFEWCNEDTESHIENLQNFDYSDYPEWKRLLLEEGRIKASNIITDLPEELHAPLISQSIQAILVYPLMVKGCFLGFIGFDECSFNREWLPHEIDLLQISAHLVANTFEAEASQQKLDAELNGQQLLLEISQLFTSGLDYPTQIQTALKQLGEHFQLSRAFLFENYMEGLFCKNTFEYCKPGIQSVKHQLQNVEYEKDLPGWKLAFRQNELVSSDLDCQSESFSCIFKQQIGTCSLIAIPIQSEDHFWGFIGFDQCHTNHQWNESHKRALRIFAEILAGVFERQSATNEIRQKHAEILKINETLANKEQFLQNLLHSAPIGIVLVTNRVIEYANKSIIESSGYSYEELIGQNVSALYAAGEENPEAIESFYSEIKSKGSASLEASMRSKQGKSIILKVIGTPAPNSNGKDSYLLIGENVTRIKRAETFLQESEDRYRTIIESTVDGIFIIKSFDKVTFVNKAACHLLDYTHDELSELSINDILPGISYMDRFREAIQRIDQGVDFLGDIQVVNKKGEIIHTEAYGTRITLEGEEHYYFSLHDITKRKKNEAALKQSEKKFRALTENSSDHILRINRSGAVSFCNVAFLKDYNLQLDNCLSKHLNEIENLPKELVNGLNTAIADINDTTTISPLSLEIVHNGSILAFDWTITPETDDNNQLVSFLLVGRNFTRRKKAEQELIIAKEKAISADRLKSAFLANMSHEIRTPLNAIVGFTNLLKEDSISEKEKGEYINIINNSSENLMDLINDIVDLAKIESGELVINEEEINPDNQLDELYQLFLRKMPLANKNHLRFYLNKPENNNKPLIKGDAKRLRQVLMNLLNNAFKFTQKGFIEFGYTADEQEIRFYVRDTGIGIAPQKHEVIFDPFRQEEESTAKHYGGTGLGLSICKRLVNNMGGTMGVLSEKGTGSEFFFTLPLVKQSNTIIKPAPAPQEIKRTIPLHPANYSWHDKLFLLVDAAGNNQLQIRKLIEPTKVTLLSARTVTSGRELLLKRSDISLALIDIDTPGLNPKEFIRSVREQNSLVPIIAFSSVLTDHEKDELLASGFSSIVCKPIVKEDLLYSINAVIEQYTPQYASY